MCGTVVGFWDRLAYRQTDRQTEKLTDTLIAIQ